MRPCTLGASFWLDGIVRRKSGSGGLVEYFRNQGISGLRFNLRRFGETIMSEASYSREISAGTTTGLTAAEIHTALLLGNVRDMADELLPVFEETGGREGFVTLPMDAEFSYDLDAMVDEGRRIWRDTNRQNIIVLVPGTEEGIRALRQLTTAGVNAGVHQLLSVRRYREACEAYLTGMEHRLARGMDVRNLTSVAEFRLDDLDSLAKRLPPLPDRDQSPAAPGLAVSTARVAYSHYLNTTHSERFRNLAAAGARAQRLAWAVPKGDGLVRSRQYPDDVIGPATVCELNENVVQNVVRRSFSGTGIREGIPEARSLLNRYQENYPDFEKDLAVEVESLIREQILYTDRAINFIENPSQSFNQ